MLLYLWFLKFVFVLVCIGRIKSCLKGVYVRKKNPVLNSYTGYLFCFMCCYIHWILLESCNALAFVNFLVLYCLMYVHIVLNIFFYFQY